MKNKILFLCTGNSSRSIMAEALLEHLGEGKFIALSAGSSPTGQVNPFSVDALKTRGIDSSWLNSKSWNELRNTPIDIVITVCDNVVSEPCPIFFSNSIKAHWGLPDPNAFQGSDSEKVTEFKRILTIIYYRVKIFVRLPLNKMSDLEITTKLNEIGKMAP